MSIVRVENSREGIRFGDAIVLSLSDGSGWYSTVDSRLKGFYPTTGSSGVALVIQSLVGTLGQVREGDRVLLATTEERVGHSNVLACGTDDLYYDYPGNSGEVWTIHKASEGDADLRFGDAVYFRNAARDGAWVHPTTTGFFETTSEGEPFCFIVGKPAEALENPPEGISSSVADQV